MKKKRTEEMVIRGKEGRETEENGDKGRLKMTRNRRK